MEQALLQEQRVASDGGQLLGVGAGERVELQLVLACVA